MKFENEVVLEKGSSSNDDDVSIYNELEITSEDLDAIGADRLTRGIVPQTDDPSTPSLTFRVFLIGGIGAIFLGLVNVILSFRTNPTVVGSTVVTLLGYPAGVFLSWALPKGILNPGPFSVKEHALLTVMASSAGGIAYGIDNVASQYMDAMMGDKRVNFWNSLAFILTSQLIGFGLSGMTRRFLVRPSAMLWPTALPTVATFAGFHEKSVEDVELDIKYPMSRFTAFWISFFILFFYTVIPNYFAQGLQAVSILCLFSSNRIFNWFSAAGQYTGAGIGALSFDWPTFGGTAAMITPWWAAVNYYGANLIWTWILTPIIWATNPFKTPYLVDERSGIAYGDGTDIYALNDPGIFMANGTRVKPAALFSKPDFDLDVSIYKTAAPIYISPMFALAYAASFMALTAGLSHCAVWYGKDIWRQAKEAWNQADDTSGDVHNRLMRAYPDIPEWMYLSFLVVMLVVQILVCEFTPFHLPWWATLLGILIPLIFLIPFGIIQAISGFQLGLNVITEFVIGLIIPGRTVPVMIFKSYSYNVFIQALALTSDLKLGHYMHINPVHMVIVQICGTIIGAITNTAGAFWVMDGTTLLGQPGWGFNGYQVFYAAGAIWGAIGPWRFFGPESPYFSLMLAFPVGLVLPVIPWLLNKVFPSKYWHLINFPLMAVGPQPGQYQVTVIMPLLVAFFTQFYLYRYKYPWFSKYNYVISAGLDAGASICLLFLFIFKEATEVLPPFMAHPLNPDTSYDFYCFEGLGWRAAAAAE